MGRLIYLIGASGVGKDSLLQAARRAHPEWLVAHRYLTRESGVDEDCVALSNAEFAVRRETGLLCLDWHAHNLNYGVGVEVESWLARDTIVLLNGSRRALPKACDRFGEALLPVVITAPTEVLRRRLIERGRESPCEVEHRLGRHREMERELAESFPGLARVDNGGRLSDSLAELTAVIEGRTSSKL
ncbi:ribose 1,5-bisphosphokinase [Vreelandella titanicae]|uniref:ribose 1,5-bisphosphokinase n=1 Tax=Vreelandella titanicae TaxID=664683 RepID=UPI0013733DFC|nr:ribose 1,5-bisphosphokinase [Halomonas titanicae]NAO98800.1 ribose 1,5-bisphosphokinase [Halomonas sp. MG34]NVE92939.1 ribose 1,5-bisphosphokinase [Halomonas titanicae]